METQQSTSTSDVSIDQATSDLRINDLVYQQPAALSLAVDRKLTKQFFQRSSYDGGKSTTMIADWNTGTSFVNLSNSYLSFKVKLTGAGGSTANFGSGSAMNILNEIRISTRSTCELERLQNANLAMKLDAQYNMPNEWFTTIGSVAGYGPTRVGATDAANTNTVTSVRFNIPLTMLSTFFRPLNNRQLLPPQLASGLHFEIVLEDFRTAFFQKVTGITGYTIESLYFQLDCVQMTDDCQRSISSISANSGLEYCYQRIYTSQTQVPVGQLSLNAQIRKACSQANYITSISIGQASRIDITVDSFNAVAFNYDSFQYRLGSLYFPNEAVSGASDGVEAYTIAQACYDKMIHSYNPGSITLASFIANQGILAASFEKSAYLDVSGLPVNNSRVCELNATYLAVAAALEVYTFLNYTSVARVFLDNTAVAI